MVLLYSGLGTVKIFFFFFFNKWRFYLEPKTVIQKSLKQPPQESCREDSPTNLEERAHLLQTWALRVIFFLEERGP